MFLNRNYNLSKNFCVVNKFNVLIHSSEVAVYAYAAAQVKKAMEVIVLDTCLFSPNAFLLYLFNTLAGNSILRRRKLSFLGWA